MEAAEIAIVQRRDLASGTPLVERALADQNKPQLSPAERGKALALKLLRGTFARDALKERVHAAMHHGTVTVVRPNGTEVVKPAAEVLPPAENLGFQTTIQRWWADEVFDKEGRDQTLRTVFTHDHFGPSTHQQVGLYATVLVEPPGSTWVHNETGQALHTRADGGPTSWRPPRPTSARGSRQTNPRARRAPGLPHR